MLDYESQPQAYLWLATSIAVYGTLFCWCTLSFQQSGCVLVVVAVNKNVLI